MLKYAHLILCIWQLTLGSILSVFYTESDFVRLCIVLPHLHPDHPLTDKGHRLCLCSSVCPIGINIGGTALWRHMQHKQEQLYFFSSFLQSQNEFSNDHVFNNTNLEIDLHYTHNYVNYLNSSSSHKPTGQTDNSSVISLFFFLFCRRVVYLWPKRCAPLVAFREKKQEAPQ